MYPEPGDRQSTVYLLFSCRYFSTSLHLYYMPIRIDAASIYDYGEIYSISASGQADSWEQGGVGGGLTSVALFCLQAVLA